MDVKFHLAFPVKDLKVTQEFYIDFLGCKLGRSTITWLDIDFFGHQLTLQLAPQANIDFRPDKQGVPIPHFGVIVPWKAWHELQQKWKDSNIEFLVSPRTVFGGTVGEQKTMILKDPNGYAVEFKSFEDETKVFRAK